jgi:hypothetical protein
MGNANGINKFCADLGDSINHNPKHAESRAAYANAYVHAQKVKNSIPDIVEEMCTVHNVFEKGWSKDLDENMGNRFSANITKETFTKATVKKFWTQKYLPSQKEGGTAFSMKTLVDAVNGIDGAEKILEEYKKHEDRNFQLTAVGHMTLFLKMGPQLKKPFVAVRFADERYETGTEEFGKFGFLYRHSGKWGIGDLVRYYQVFALMYTGRYDTVEQAEAATIADKDYATVPTRVRIVIQQVHSFVSNGTECFFLPDGRMYLNKVFDSKKMNAFCLKPEVKNGSYGIDRIGEEKLYRVIQMYSVNGDRFQQEMARVKQAAKTDPNAAKELIRMGKEWEDMKRCEEKDMQRQRDLIRSNEAAIPNLIKTCPLYDR